MSIPSNWTDFVVSNDGWLIDSAGNLRSNKITHAKETTLVLRFVFAAEITIAVSSEASYDFLEVVAEGREIAKISGETTKSIQIPQGKVKFRYYKDGSADAGEDSGWISNIPNSAFWDGLLTESGNWEQEFIINQSAANYTVNTLGLTNIGSENLYLKIINKALADGHNYSIGGVLIAGQQGLFATLAGGLVFIFNENGETSRQKALNNDDLAIILAPNESLLSVPCYTAVEPFFVPVILQLLYPQITNDFTPPTGTGQAVFQAAAIPFIGVQRGALGLNKPTFSTGQPYLYGYIEAKVTAAGIPQPNRRVLCFTQAGALIGETRSDKQGMYRFDNLYMHEIYMLVAQDIPVFREGAEYNAVAADFQKAVAYDS